MFINYYSCFKQTYYFDGLVNSNYIVILKEIDKYKKHTDKSSKKTYYTLSTEDSNCDMMARVTIMRPGYTYVGDEGLIKYEDYLKLTKEIKDEQ